MSVDARNMINISGGLLADPEVVNEGRLVKLRIGVDYAGSPRADEDQNNKSGYFNVNMWLTEENNPNVRFVKDQIGKGNFKKGTPVQILGRLQHDRYTTKDGNREQVLIIAESMNYWGRAQSQQSASSGSTDASTSADAETEGKPEPAFKF